ncbi:D-amino-acid dehydrogenase [Bartonella choladocola]|uniref:D-amino-acid dehydrogenase n=2 Tax=Bartonellaceae TaxID=772 RepID=A0A1U9MJK3_9HYPH|nr:MULTISPECIES: FAD-binding oxidoreductase [Bartonella]AQT48036.1 D-amino-acid dehydrogenase [Bartonella choladocola]
MGMREDKKTRVAVLGAGIIGTTIAYELQKRGKSVVLIDRNEPGRGASFGNMASIAVTEFLPSSRPSILSQIPKWVFDPEGPVSIRPAYLPRMAFWLVRFLKAARPKTMEALSAAGAALCHRALTDLQSMLDGIDNRDALSSEGCISLYGSKAELDNDNDHISTLERYGFDYRILSAKDVKDLEPAITDHIHCGLLFPDNKSVSDPYLLVQKFLAAFLANGGEVLKGEVTGFRKTDDQIRFIQLADGRTVAVDEAVLSAGAYTGRLSKLLGEPIPLETERGYHTQIMKPNISLRHSIIWPARAFMVTPTAGGIRVGGTVEMAGLDAAPDYRRSKITVRHAKEALPELTVEDATEWMGHRPALPDTVPIISPSAKVKNLFYATGHGHLGVTYSATTAQLIADMMTNIPIGMDMTPYRVDRF